MKSQLDLFPLPGDAGVEYDHAFIVNNPILALCLQGKSPYCRHKPEQIHAPQLENVRCFWCGGKMRPMHPQQYQERLQTLWQHVKQA